MANRDRLKAGVRAVNDKITVKHSICSTLNERHIDAWTDRYFRKTKAAVEAFGDNEVTYAIFMRRPVVFAPKLMIQWLDSIAEQRNTEFQINLNYMEGQWVGAGEPLLYIGGLFSQ